MSDHSPSPEALIAGAGGVFVSGTDTEIGKTLLAGILTKAWNASYWKPVQSGMEERTDSQWVAQWVGAEHVLPEGYLLQRPLSPNQSAAKEGRSLDLDRLELPRKPRPLVVEGAGGLLVPLNRNALMIDLIQRTGLPVILAARASLGTINHSLLSIEALRERGIALAGVVLIGDPHPDNAADIQHFGKLGAGRLGALPWLSSIRGEDFELLYRRHLSFLGMPFHAQEG